MTEDDVREMVREEAGKRGLSRWCAARKINRSPVALFLLGIRRPGPDLLASLSLKPVVTYEKQCCNSETDARHIGRD